MKRLALSLAASSVIAFSALAGGAVHAYQPVDDEVLTVDPQQGLPEFEFTATLANCFPGETVLLAIAASTWVAPDEPPAPQVPPAESEILASATEQCPLVGALQVSHTFNAPTDFDIYPVIAFMEAEDDPNPDIPDRPVRLLVDYITVSDTTVPIGFGTGADGADLDGGAAVMSAGGSRDIWPSFLSAAAFYRTFLALFALLAGVFFVVLWRRRREDEELGATYGSGALTSPDASNPSMA